MLAAGRSERFGSDKAEAMLGDRPVWRWSVDAFLANPGIHQVILAAAPMKIAGLQMQLAGSVKVVAGGETRQESSLAVLKAADAADILLIHDAARPFVSQKLITRTIEAILRSGAAGVAMPVTDTIKEVMQDGIRTLDRSKLVAMQTPQGARVPLLVEAHAKAGQSYTDEMALVEAQGIHPELVTGEPQNFKITTPDDLDRARGLLGPGETRVGIGYDIHAFSDDPARKLFLGGVEFAGHRALAGHSDADVVLHAATDALLGAAGLGDIGQHFPDTDARWKGEPSRTFLAHACALLQDRGWEVVNIDVSVLAEAPKIMPRATEMRAMMAETMGFEASRVSLKATTNERLGAIGRSEGIAAFAVANISRLPIVPGR